MLAGTLSRLIILELTESNPPEKGDYENGYTMFKQLSDIHADSKNSPVPPINISSINNTNDNVLQNKDIENTETVLSLSIKEMIHENFR